MKEVRYFQGKMRTRILLWHWEPVKETKQRLVLEKTKVNFTEVLVGSIWAAYVVLVFIGTG